MNTPFDIEQAGGERIVYVRPVKVAELPDDVRKQIPELDYLFALHDSDGQRLALVRDRKLAFALARENDLAPVNVH